MWDEVASLTRMPECIYGLLAGCSCDLLGRFTKLESRIRLMQFLMGLNDTYEHVRNHILSINPLPFISKTYYLVHQVEKQN